MDTQKQTLRICAAVLLGVCLLRLASIGFFNPALKLLDRPDVASLLVYLQTGRAVRRICQGAPDPSPSEAVSQTDPILPTICLPDFTAEDLARIQLDYRCSYRPDLADLLTRDISLGSAAEGPSVLILHTHTTECYTATGSESYELSSPYRTLDAGHNMIVVGHALAQRLQEAGIAVIHSKAIHDYPSYNGAYDRSAQTIQAILEENPSIQLVLDLHRDAADTSQGQFSTQCTVKGQSSAQLMLVVGTDAGGLSHPDWQKNLSLALKLQALLERENPGICRELNLVSQRYNQHLSAGAVLVEVGAAGNTMEEALVAVGALADAIITLIENN